MLSVLMSIYKGEFPLHLRDCLSSLSSQTVKADEVVIVEDGPIPTELHDIIEEYRVQLNIISVQLGENKGLAAALNQGLSCCNFDMIARMDTDDIALPDRFEKQITYLSNHPNVDVLGSWIIEFDSENRKKIIKYPLEHKDMLIFFRKRDPLAHPSVVFRRSFFIKSGEYNPSLRKDQDTELWFRGFKNKAIFANIQEPLLLFRVLDSTYARRKNYKRIFKFVRLRLYINRELGFGLLSYIYLCLYILVQLSPPAISKFARKNLR
jgi:glycosyltransferase involved in cell wall biosynthesis